MRILVKAIRSYYTDNRLFPQDVSQLTYPIAYIETIPQDPFNDQGKPYVYITNGVTCRVYSLGPDSDDDFGNITYDPKNGNISNGDIVVEVER